jgi:hypothetical protein
VGSKSQARNAHTVINHINFSMMAVTLTWIYGALLANIPERGHKVKGRNSFAFSDLRHIIAKAALSEDFGHDKLTQKFFVDALLRMVVWMGGAKFKWNFKLIRKRFLAIGSGAASDSSSTRQRYTPTAMCRTPALSVPNKRASFWRL